MRCANHATGALHEAGAQSASDADEVTDVLPSATQTGAEQILEVVIGGRQNALGPGVELL